MKIDTWLAISAGAAFLLAIAAFWSIWQNHKLQQKEHKRRCLQEITNWAKDGFVWINEKTADTVPERQRTNKLRLTPIKASCQSMKNLSKVFDIPFHAKLN